MSDTTPTPQDPDRTLAEPAARPVDQPADPLVEQPAAQPSAPPFAQREADPAYPHQVASPQHAAQPRPSGTRWWTSRAPLLAIAAALLLGCLVGGGIVAVGAFVFGDHRGHGSFEHRPGGPDGPGWRRMPRGERGGPPDQQAPAPANPPAPAPTAS